MFNYYKKHKIVFFTFLVLTFLFYGNSLKNKYALDDEYITVTNFPIKGKEKEYVPNQKLVSKGLGGIVGIWKSRYAHDSEGAFDYRPIATTSFAIEYAIFGQNSFVSHLINILLYFLTVWLFYCLLLQLFDKTDKNQQIVFLAALLFLIHPIHTEVVNNLKCRDELICMLSCFIALWFSIKYIDSPSIKNLFLIILFFLIAHFSKRTAMIFFGVIPLALIIYRKLNWKQTSLLLSVFVIVYALIPIIKMNIVTEKVIRSFHHFENPFYTDNVSFIHKIIVAIKTFGYYIHLLVFPYPLRNYYGANMFDMSASLNIYFFISILFLGASAYYIYKTKNKTALFALLLFCGAIAPFTNLVTPAPGIIGERFAFVASTGFCLLIAVIISKYFNNQLFSSPKQFMSKPFMSLSPIILIFMFYTWNRNSDWQSKLILFERDIKKSENSAKANSLIANEYMEMLRSNGPKKYSDQVLIQKCIHHYQTAIKNDSTLYTAYNNVGVIYFSHLREIDNAEKYFRLAIKIKPEYAQAFENLGNCYGTKNDTKSALEYYKKAILIKPKQFTAYTSAVSILFNQKKYDNCIKLLSIAHTQFPNNYELIAQEANSILMKGDTINAISKFEDAYNIFPNQNLAQFLNKKYKETGSGKTIK